MATGDTTDAAGMYVLCGIPRGATFEVHAQGADSASGSMSLPIDQMFIRQDLIVGATEATVMVTGRLVASDSVPVQGATIRLRADTTVSATSEADGSFRLRVPARTGQLQVRALGFAPREELIEPPAEDGTGSATIRLGNLRLRTVQELGRVSIVADGATRERLEFEERRKFNFQGTFFDDEELAKLPVIRPAVLAGKVPRSFLDKNGKFYLAANGGWCLPHIFVDGGDYGGGDRDPTQYELQFWMQRAKRIEVYRATFAPVRYSGSGGCGSVVIWTK
jgi:hypothetical protein